MDGDKEQQRKRTNSKTSEDGNSPDAKRVAMSDSPGLKLAEFHNLNIELPSDDAPTSDWFKVLFKKMDMIYEMYHNLEENMKYLNCEMNDTKIVLKNVSDKMGNLEKRVSILEKDNTQLRRENVTLNEGILVSEIRRRETNLIFDGVTDSFREDHNFLYQKILQKLNHMEVFNGSAGRIPILKAQRLGAFVRERNRPVLCQFLKHFDVQTILANRRQLPGGIFVREDYPQEIEERRRKLRPIFNMAKNNKAYKGKCRLTVDKLVINNRTFTVAPINNLDKLPLDLAPRKTAEKENEDILAFFTQASPFSNFYDASFEKDGVRYACSEQYIQAQKAEIFNDTVALNRIMGTTNPYEIKNEGSRVQNFVAQVWIREAEKIAYDACFAKFSQNDELKLILLGTKGKELAEASTDVTWGVGLYLKDRNILNKSIWTGQNLLGKVLMKVRHDLR